MSGIQSITALFQEASKPSSARRIGLEVERLGMWPDGDALRYSSRIVDGHSRPGAESLLRELSHRENWPMVMGHGEKPIGLKAPMGKVSLEPGSQLELSVDPHVSLFQVADRAADFEAKVGKITTPWGLKWLGIGSNPTNGVNEIDVIPSDRYDIMTEYLGKVGERATRMMRLTTSVQINLDYSSEADAIEMLRVALALAPLSYALFGNSPFEDGKLTNYLSWRGAIWQKTDNARSGLFHEAFEPDFNFEKYATRIWNYPLMFAENKAGLFVAAQGKSLADIARGALPGVEIDENNQMHAIRELFTEARLKPGYVEVRSVDGQRPAMRFASAAFWMGALYDGETRSIALARLKKLDSAGRENLYNAAIRDGLDGKAEGIHLHALGCEIMAAVRKGLISRGFGEEAFLVPVEEMLTERLNPAQKLVQLWGRSWNNQFQPLIEYCGEEDPWLNSTTLKTAHIV